MILAALNAKYIHSNLALRYLSRFQHNNRKHHVETMEFTINQRLDFIAEELFRKQPDVVLFSCYIWNVEMLRQLCPILKKIMPDCVIGFGGPEVSYESETFLRENPTVDFVIRGEGELVFTKYLEHLNTGNPATLGEIESLTYRQGEEIFSTPQMHPMDLALLPFPYEEDFSDVRNQIIYYESSRGCPYHCGYCLSSVENGVRFVPLDKVLPDLQKFLDKNVPQVKFIDRTFNCKKSHAMAIWKYLHEHDNGVTNFHFEITADLIDQETIDFLKTVRKGLFQFEIGVQSTNPQTIRAINRNVDFAALSEIVQQIKDGGNIHQHLDLIAGLPYEDYNSFGRSFNDVYALHPEQLQLGFLKVLKGSMLHQKQEEFEIVYHDTAPYEVLTTHELPYADTLRLKYVEEMVETYYNSGRFLHTLAYLVPLYESPFAFFEALSQFWIGENYHYLGVSRMGLFDVLWRFVEQNPKVEKRKLQWEMKFDIALHEKPKKLPAWMTVTNEEQWHDKVFAFYGNPDLWQKCLPHYKSNKEAIRQTHLEVLGDEEKKAVLFDYGKRDLLGNAEHKIMETTEIQV
ncbi:B12-binding domain-containing radical SAM protein [Anaerotignum sp.]|uniref:B12-binding domain-containing radical SAM protein n=1 Tax=Anaerotignum sp. TaxID=2039241 RepID=UPI002A90C656|nr:B12-binding domain-containing radical SAM protein [Anaerotignum sp.]MCI7657195.1 B12-binding domain-containing radical SAM protein [Clostridia bacterium]MDY5415608.1 B12-binding domain-containing radical SAM protein [Anaerotignum sp.]